MDDDIYSESEPKQDRKWFLVAISKIGRDKVALLDRIGMSVQSFSSSHDIYSTFLFLFLFPPSLPTSALIAGGAVGLLFAVFLILLLIYRMKKKDEGSYDLGKKPIYKKAPTNEFYA